ncbi:hypothetical protein Trydic_g3730 [Trypoxylus dichotomus]
MSEDVAIDVSGQMVTPPEFQTKKTQFSFLQFHTQIPDPKDWFQQQRQNVRPWLVFMQSSNFKVAPSIPRLMAYCLITSPLVLLAISGSFYAGYKLSQRHRERKFILLGKELTLAQQYGIVAMCSMPIYYLVGAHGAMFWVLGASLFIITLHAAFYNIDALVNEEESYVLTQDV